MIDFTLLDLSNKDDQLKVVRDMFNVLNNIQWLLFILVILLGLLLGIYIFNCVFGGKE